MRFEDAISYDFLQKYGDKLLKSGVVNGNGELNYDDLFSMWVSMDGETYPYRYRYAVVYGVGGLMGMWETPARFRGHEEKIYKMCLEEGKTWKELLDYKEPGRDVLL